MLEKNLDIIPHLFKTIISTEVDVGSSLLGFLLTNANSKTKHLLATKATIILNENSDKMFGRRIIPFLLGCSNSFLQQVGLISS